MSKRYGPTPPWHDVQVAIRGPAVGDVDRVFRERWQDPTPLTRNPLHRIADRLRREDISAGALPPQPPDPPPCGTHAVQLLRTYPHRDRGGYPFARQGERSIARGYCKMLGEVRELLYLEDQYLWSPQVARRFAEALRERPGLRLVAVVPLYPDEGGGAAAPAYEGRREAVRVLREAGGSRVAVYGLENEAGTPVYVHAKVCIADDSWAAVGSDNLNLRSWTYDTELSCAVVDTAGGYARALRLALAREHLGRAELDDGDLVEPAGMFAAFAASAGALEAWHQAGRTGARPPGRLRAYHPPGEDAATRTWAGWAYRLVYDPDGRPRRLRRGDEF
jgi:phosphatidylserine/phosphatidylglycerophosphate/cardiolipin synthase-like enzyme